MKFNINNIKAYAKIKEKFLALGKPQRVVTVLISLFLFIDVILSVVVIVNGGKKLTIKDNEKNVSFELKPLNKAGKKNRIKEPEYALYQFSDKVINAIAQKKEEKGNCSIAVLLEFTPTDAQSERMYGSADFPVRIGFLNSSDFNKKGKYTTPEYNLVKKITVQGNVTSLFNKSSDTFSKTLVISMALKKDGTDEDIPKGLLIYSSLKTKIHGVYLREAEMGYSTVSDIPYYGFGPNGGIIDFSNSSFDFSGASLVFPVANTVSGIMPEYVVSLSDDKELKSKRDEFVSTVISYGGEKLSIRNVDSSDFVIIPSGAIKRPFSRMDLSDNKTAVTAVILKNSDAFSESGKSENIRQAEVITPIKTDPGLILNYNPDNWRALEYEVFEWDRFPGILFFDTRNYDIQSKFFTRLAYFVEKEGFKGKLMSNEYLEGKHGYNAHDYSAVSMAAFFNKAAEEQFQLNEEEYLLKKILIKTGLFTENGIYVNAGDGGIVSISQETAAWSRKRLLAHEGWHTLYFNDEEFRNYVAAVYYTMDPASLQFLKDYFHSQPTLGYDQNDEYLMKNEFMAYIMQQPLNEVSKNFVGYANWDSVNRLFPVSAAYIRNNKAQAFEDAAAALDDFVFTKYGIICGNIALVNR